MNKPDAKNMRRAFFGCLVYVLPPGIIEKCNKSAAKSIEKCRFAAITDTLNADYHATTQN
jgi:hypothetical protein